MSTNASYSVNTGKTNIEYFEASNILDAEGQFKGMQFDELSVRKNFIRKVYLILMAQLVLTFGVVAIFVFNESLKLFVLRNPSLFWLAFIVLMITMIAMACCDKVRRQTPMNYIFLGMFTLAESLMLAIVTCQFAPLEILTAVGITAALCLALSLYAMQTKYDYTMFGGILLIALVVLLIFGLFTLFFPGRTIMLVYSSLGAVIFCIYMIYDTQLMLGGQHKYSLSPEEYVFAALNLYLDIINIFLNILSLITSGSN